MIDKLIAALQIEEVKELTGELTGELLVDVLWLWSKKLSKASNYSLSNQDSRTNSTQEVEELTRPIQKDDDEDVHPQPTPREAIPKKADTPLEPQNTSQQTATGTGVYPKTTSETQESKSAGDLSIRLPSAPSLREKLKLSRSLKSLMHRMPSIHNTVLDEVATVEQIAEKQIWIPVLNPALEPWLELALVVDESPSMLIWRDTIVELRRLLEYLGIFRDVRTWGLFTNPKGVVQIRPEIGAVARGQSARSPRELVDPNGRRLILILSDCVSPMWRKQRKENEVIQALNIWANSGPMAIVQMLPKWLWSRTALGLAVAVQLCGLTPGVANQQLLFRRISAWDELDEARDIKVPVLTLEPTMVATWSQMVAGMGTIWVSGFMFQSDFGTVDEDDDADTNSTQELTAQRSFQRFRLTASPMARRLAGLVAAAPIVSLPVIRLIQETMLPESQQVHVAEVLLGGLLKLKSTTKIETDTNPNEVEYQFIDGVSEILLESLPASHQATVKIALLQRMTKYVADRIGLSRETFAGFLKDPRLINSTTQQINPIATIGVQALKRLGGEYASLAEELEQDFQVPFFPKTKKVYALLVGIDKYHPESGVPNVSGCVNDVEAIEEFLQKQINTEKKWEIVENSEVPWKLTNELATRQAIIDGFQKHLCQATSEDVVLFYYAGHGSYEAAPEVFRLKDSVRQINTLICYDSRTEQGRDLADKELSYLVEQVAKNNPHIVIVLDCSHSGAAPRDATVAERQTSADRRVRDLKEFIFPEEWLKYRLSASYEAPRHVAIAACRAHQTAKEHKGEDGKRRGAFSYFFTQALQRTNGKLSYADLFQDVNALLLSKVTDQSPQIEALAEDLAKTFLGGAADERLNHFTLTYNTRVHDDWVINGGALHGIRPKTEGETVLAIFPQGTQPEQLSDISHAICHAVVTRVQLEVSKVEFITDSSLLSLEEPYWAVIISVPIPQMKVNFVGDEQGIELARMALTTVNEGEPSLFIREAKSSENAYYELEAHQGQYWINQASERRSIVAPIPLVPDNQGYTQQRAVQIIKRLEHVVRWTHVLELKTPQTSQIQPGDVDLEVIIISDGREYSSKMTADLRGEYTFKNNRWIPPEIKLKVTNHSKQDIYFQIVELAGNYSISIPEFFTERGSIVLSKKSSDGFIPSSTTSETLDLVIPRAYLNSGVTEYNDIFKLIVSDKDFDASLLAQQGLDTPPVTRSTGLSGTLNRSMDNVYSRQSERWQDENIEYVPSDGSALRRKADNWMTEEVKLTLVKPPSGGN